MQPPPPPFKSTPDIAASTWFVTCTVNCFIQWAVVKNMAVSNLDLSMNSYGWGEGAPQAPSPRLRGHSEPKPRILFWQYLLAGPVEQRGWGGSSIKKTWGTKFIKICQFLSINILWNGLGVWNLASCTPFSLAEALSCSDDQNKYVIASIKWEWGLQERQYQIWLDFTIKHTNFTFQWST